MSTVRIPPTLRTATGGEKRVDVRATRSARSSPRWSSAHPGLEAQLLGQDGDLNSFVNAFLNDTDIRHLDGLDTRVTDRRHAVTASGDGRRVRARRDFG